jgi:hypothetical protein
MKLISIQNELKAPKGQTNKFGGYKYRSCEDILEALKPLLFKHECVVTISDEIVEVGGRVYVKATVIFTDCKGGREHVVSAFAREAESKKGMDDAQVTGSASSYARKYALNGMFAIDDTKDADTRDNSGPKAVKSPAKPTPAEAAEAKAKASEDTQWFELKWPFGKPEKYAGCELATVAAAGDVKSLETMKGYFVKLASEETPYLTGYILKIDKAITEAKSQAAESPEKTPEF